MSKLYALVGHPLDHSISAEYFSTKFQTEGIDARYINLDLSSLKQLPSMLLRHPQLRGFNVTSPYKIAILERLYHIDQEAEYIGAVNTVVIKRHAFVGKRLYGFNTDVEGFSESIKPLLSSRHTAALILGTGGAARAVARAFKRMRIDSTLVSRRVATERVIGYHQVNEDVLKRHLIVVNATPLGMSPNTLIAPPIPYENISPEHLCYDLIYAPEETLFLSRCKEQGAETKNGADMLVIQAEEAWRIWQSF